MTFLKSGIGLTGQLKFYTQPAAQCSALICFLLGGWFLWIPTILFPALLAIPHDHDIETDSNKTESWLGDFPLYLSAGLGISNFIAFTFVIADFATADIGLLWTNLGYVIAATCAFGLSGGALHSVAHELFHRKAYSFFFFLGQFLMGLGFATSMALEHIYGHHRQMGLYQDPTTARRNEGFWAFTWRNLIDVNRMAWKIESEFLARKNRSILSFKNRILIGYAMQISLFIWIYCWTGFIGVVSLFCSCILAGIILCLINYVGHYGLVRAPGKRAEIHHSWNFKGTIGEGFTFNLSRHADHHIHAQRKYKNLKNTSDIVTYPHNILIMFGFALIPPLFRAATRDELQHWDDVLASKEERAILRRQAASLNNQYEVVVLTD